MIEKGNSYTWNGTKFAFVTTGQGVEYWHYTYDLLNQLEKVEKNEVETANYIYDPNGFRVQKKGGQGRIDYVPLLNGEVGYRKEFQTNQEYSFIYIGGQHLARVNGVIGGSGKKFFYHNDHQGSALMITDENGNKVVDRNFSPFGQRINTDIYDEGTKDPDETDDGFTGKDFDEDIGLYYYNARWYDQEVGRFISEDSVADDPNLYGYCHNNPVNRIDPSGHAASGTGGFKIGFIDPSKNPLGFINATVNALAALTGDSNLSNVMSVFNLFIAIDYWVQKQKIQDALNNLIKNNQPINEATLTSYKSELGRAGEEKLAKLLIEKGYKIVSFVKNTNTHGVDIAVYKDGILYLIDAKESLKTGKVIYSVKGFQDPERFRQWKEKLLDDVQSSEGILTNAEKKEILAILENNTPSKLKLVVATAGENIKRIGPKLKRGIEGLEVIFKRGSDFLAITPEFLNFAHSMVIHNDINDIRAGKYGMVLQMELQTVESYRHAPLNDFILDLKGNLGELSGYDSGGQYVQDFYSFFMENIYNNYSQVY